MRSRRTIPAALAAAAAIAAVVFLAVRSGAQSDLGIDADAPRPNIVLIQTDDQTLDSLNRKTMPATMSLLADRGTTFSQYVVASPLCCPSRASLETGQYPHNNGIVANQPGYPALTEKHNTLPTWLREAGYRTAHLGKYLNQYDHFVKPRTRPAPGWDRWVSLLSPYSYFDYSLAIDGGKARFGDSRSDYLTTVLNREASRLIEEFSAEPDPFFIQVDQLAPHGQSEQSKGPCGLTAQPLPGDYRRFADYRLPRPASFNEEDLSDKPAFRQLVEQIPEQRIESIEDNYRCRLATLRAVDRGVKRIHRTLKATGELDRTVIVFTSDNGFLRGEHRIPSQKAQAYEEAVRVPLLVRAPKSAIGRGQPIAEVAAPTANIDLAPTFLELAGARPCRTAEKCRTLDGRSLVPLLAERNADWPTDRAILTRFSSGHEKNVAHESCEFTGARTTAFSYVEHGAVPNPSTRVCEPAEARELYDLRADPFQLDNLAGPEGSGGGETRVGLERRLAELEACAGVEGRDERVDDHPFCE